MNSSHISHRFARALPARGTLLRAFAQILALACFTFLMEESMHFVGFFNGQFQAIWWPTNGLALALMVRNDRSRWPVILAGVLLGSWLGEVNYGYSYLAPSNLDNAVANSVGPLLGALMLPRFKKLEDWLQEPHLVLRFVVFSLVLAPVLSAIIYASYMYLSSRNMDFWTVLQTRADSDMLGYAIFTPLVLVLTSRKTFRGLQPSGLAMPFLLLATVAATTYLVFWQSSYSLSFVLTSVILLVSLRLGFAASVLAVNLLACLATAATMHGLGPLTMGGGADLDHRILLLQGYLALTMVTVFSVSVIQLERKVFGDKLQLAYDQMEKLATTDTLTGLANRRLFEETLFAEWARAKRSGNLLALLTIDVDHFKSYNDRFGHPAGDACLRAVAKSILALDHRSTDLLARYGGEEFLFLFPATPLAEASRMAEVIRKRIESLHKQVESGGDSRRLDEVSAQVTVSIGCAAMAPGPELSPNTLIAASDEALFRAKQNGRNRVEVAEAPATPFELNRIL